MDFGRGVTKALRGVLKTPMEFGALSVAPAYFILHR
jgi:hypothetical protein